MRALVEAVVAALVEDKSAIRVFLDDTKDVDFFTIVVADSDVGRVVGKQGRVVNALRTLVRSASPRRSPASLDVLSVSEYLQKKEDVS